MRFFERLTQPEIAERVGVSQSYLSRLLRRVLADLRASRLFEADRLAGRQELRDLDGVQRRSLARLSVEQKNASPCWTVSSRRRRPTYTGSAPAAWRGVGAGELRRRLGKHSVGRLDVDRSLEAPHGWPGWR